jgi:hypothetical protein
LKELEQFCLEEWTKLVARCAKLIETYRKRLVAANGDITKY